MNKKVKNNTNRDFIDICFKIDVPNETSSIIERIKTICEYAILNGRNTDWDIVQESLREKEVMKFIYTDEDLKQYEYAFSTTKLIVATPDNPLTDEEYNMILLLTVMYIYERVVEIKIKSQD